MNCNVLNACRKVIDLLELLQNKNKFKKMKYKIFKKLSALIFGLFFFSLISAPTCMAQSNFNPPSVLPGDNANIGGYGSNCVGLANMIRTGDLSLRQVPCFIKFFAQTLIAIAGSVAVIFVMVGGYQLVLGSDASKDTAKKTITNALLGLAISLMAWVLVDLVLQFITE